LSESDNEVKQNLNTICSEFPDFDFSKEIIRPNHECIRTVLSPKKAMHAYFHQPMNNQAELELGNFQSLPVEVLSASYKDSLLFYPRQETVLLRKQPSNLVDYHDISFSFPGGFNWSDSIVIYLKVNYRLLGTSQIRQETVFPWSYLSEDFSDNNFVRKQPNLDKFDFLVINGTTQEILTKPGTWNLDQDLNIPKGYRVIALDGTQLDLCYSL
jgi:hypothetical protein